MNKIITLALALTTLNLFGQTTENPTAMAQPIVEEGKRLYRSEMASWYGTDLFLERYKNRENIGGYFSYTEKDRSKCIFFSGADQPLVIGTITFDSTYSTETAVIDLTERAFAGPENDLFTIRGAALEAMYSDTIFRTYKNTNLNLIPLIYGEEKKVYVLTGPKESGVVIFGNDYLITFDTNNKLTGKKQLHRNIIPIHYGEEGKESAGAMHSHLPETGDFITATDICTLMLYEKFAKWKQHSVISAKYMNLWDCLTDQLVVVPREIIDKINEDQEKPEKEQKKKKKKDD